MRTTSLYNKVFDDKAYNPKSGFKIQIVEDWLDDNNFDSILDVGCGRGHYLKALNYNIMGIEPSTFLCRNDLKDLKVINTDIIGYRGNSEALYCMDVLEHISEDDIDDVLAKLANVAPNALLGIANHSDLQFGTELHLIQEDATWWSNKLSEYYDRVKLTYEPVRYMVFECLV